MAAFRIIITKKDIDKAGPFTETKNCPMAKVLQIILDDKDIETCHEEVFKQPYSPKNIVGKLNPGFYADDYEKLKEGQIEEFVTEYTPI